ncbi:MAG: sigma-70 family RNA polymerase sigma factor [Isosphaeraceae bacterium]|nr:sigma-70 family RNA polymerase sigma factor [Isosphaeraceae bacterium]
MSLVPSSDEPPDDAALVERAGSGDPSARRLLFDRHRARLESMIDRRMDARLRGRLDAADVVQETLIEADRRFDRFVAETDPRAVPFFLWLRTLAQQKLVDLTRFHLNAGVREAGREAGSLSVAGDSSSEGLAAFLLGRLTSPSQAAVRAEVQDRVRSALEILDPIDREILMLRHFEQLSNAEIAECLGLTPAGASNRYVRALKRMKALIEAGSGGDEGRSDA